MSATSLARAKRTRLLRSERISLYYFTSKDFGLQSLRDKRLKIARFNELNDPFDFVGIALNTTTERLQIKPIKNRLDKTTGILCMSTTWQEPLLWGHYADKHKGMCLKFDCELKDWHKITYREERPTLKTFGKNQISDLSTADVHKISTMKFSKWEYEQEYRMFVPIANPDLVTGMHFRSFDESMRLSRVILGSRCDVEREKIHTLCKHNGSKVTFIKSRPANRSFNVIKDLAYDDDLA